MHSERRPPATLVVLPLLVAAAVLASCGTSPPPRPPEVDDAVRHPVNDPRALETIRLQLELSRLRETGGEAASRAPAPAPANTVYVITFGFGLDDIHLGTDELLAFIEAAKASPYIVIRGRTDGRIESAAQSRTARNRAQNMRAFLVGAGVDPARVRVTYQPVGDPVADNATAAGQALNRRVEVELYVSEPRTTWLGTGPDAPRARG